MDAREGGGDTGGMQAHSEFGRFVLFEQRTPIPAPRTPP
jgi:hypothetical protein